MADKFETQIDKFVLDTEEKVLAVTKEAIQSVVKEAQLEGPSNKNPGKGGKMRVDTGFLRASGVAQLGSLPSGPSKRDPNSKYSWSTDPLGVVLASMDIGDVFYFGWTAKYATTRELYDGFVESAAQNWQSHIDKAVKRLKG